MTNTIVNIETLTKVPIGDQLYTDFKGTDKYMCQLE